jgi:hypothetical protein
MPTVPKVDSLHLQTEIAFIEMLHAEATGSPGLRAAAVRLDSLVQRLDFASIHSGRAAHQAIATARVFEKLGDNRRAYAAIGRMAVWTTEAMPYLGLQLRETARIAARTGDTKRAVRTYRHFLGLRALAEPGMKAQVDSVRLELAALESGR